MKGRTGPERPRPDASWADRLYARGWTNGNLAKAQKEETKHGE
jgi:hypothetical protein